jgi:hypothetical protein
MSVIREVVDYARLGGGRLQVTDVASKSEAPFRAAWIAAIRSAILGADVPSDVLSFGKRPPFVAVQGDPSREPLNRALAIDVTFDPVAKQ